MGGFGMRETLRRELRVAFSRRGQPIWFRVAKWTVFIALGIAFWRRPTFWAWVVVAFVLGMLLHLFYRHKTCCWTRAWGRWNDLDAGR
jgi:hypothetical protein